MISMVVVPFHPSFPPPSLHPSHTYNQPIVVAGGDYYTLHYHYATPFMHQSHQSLTHSLTQSINHSLNQLSIARLIISTSRTCWWNCDPSTRCMYTVMYVCSSNVSFFLCTKCIFLPKIHNILYNIHP